MTHTTHKQTSGAPPVDAPTQSEVITVAALAVSLGKMDGGGRRIAAFRRALDRIGAVRIVAVGPQGETANDHAVHSPLHRAKRRLFPVPFRGRVSRSLGSPPHDGPTVSLVPSAHHWSLARGPVWLDYPDLWSEIARTHSLTVDPLSAAFNRVQGQLWSRRESLEYRESDAVSVASWTDRDHLGNDAIWLPTPVTDRLNTTRRPVSTSSRVCGMIANFDYPPNRDAYRRLTTDWLPKLTDRFERIVVAGYGSDRLPGSASIEILGPVDSLESFYADVDAVVAPIERGGGMKVKVVEAMMHGVPVIASEHAADGLPPAISSACIHIDAPRELSDPREVAAVADALQHFTFDNFERQFRAIWLDRMVSS